MKKIVPVLSFCLGLMLAMMHSAIAQVPYVSNYNWSGPYFGVSAGYGLGKTTIDDQDCNVSCSSQTLTPAGGLFGLTLGYNYQVGNAVVGVEADTSAVVGANSRKATDWPSLHKAAFNGLSTIRLRGGLAVNNALIYATGGLAVVNTDVSAWGNQTYGNYGFSQNNVQYGLAVGGGMEFSISKEISAKFEYLFVTFPSKSNIHDQGGRCTSGYCNYGESNSMNVLRFGLNYHF